jgi:hypothetical protein
MHDGATIANQAGRLRLGVTARDLLDLGCWNVAFLLGKLRCVLSYMLLDSSDLLIVRCMIIRRYAHIFEVISAEQSFVHDDVNHGQHNQTIHANLDRDPLSRQVTLNPIPVPLFIACLASLRLDGFSLIFLEMRKKILKTKSKSRAKFISA